MTTRLTLYKPVAGLKLTLVIILIISIVFPLLFAYINSELTRDVLTRELVLTPIRLLGITLIVFGVIWGSNLLFKAIPNHFTRYLFELPLIWFFTFNWLVFIYQNVEPYFRNVETLPTDTWNFRQHIGIFLVATVFIFVFQSGLNFYRLAQQKAQQLEKIQQEFAQVRLQALRSQVNPHFLFNSLSVLSSLVHVDAELSEKFIVQLSKAYRYILDQDKLHLISLKNELDFLNAYFFLLQIRFDKKVQLVQEIDIDPEVYQLPPLTLQLLVENAVKHNKMSVAFPLRLTIKTMGDDLVVENNISAREQGGSSTGIGLENIQNRYALVSDKKITIENNGDKFIVTIPLLKL